MQKFIVIFLGWFKMFELFWRKLERYCINFEGGMIQVIFNREKKREKGKVDGN